MTKFHKTEFFHVTFNNINLCDRDTSKLLSKVNCGYIAYIFLYYSLFLFLNSRKNNDLNL